MITRNEGLTIWSEGKDDENDTRSRELSLKITSQSSVYKLVQDQYYYQKTIGENPNQRTN